MKKPSIIKQILSFVSKVFVVLLIMCCLGFGSFEVVTHYLTGSFYDFKKASEEVNSTETAGEKETSQTASNEDVNSTLLFIDGSDNMSEYIVLSMINKKTNAMDLILLPENAQVTVSKKIQKKLSQKLDGISNTVEFDDIERAYGDEMYDVISEIIGEMIGLNIDGWDHMTSEQAISFLDTVKHVTLNLDDSVSYRDNDGILQMIQEGEVSLEGEEAFAYMTYLDGTDSQESNRLERCNTYLEKFIARLMNKKNADGIIEAYSANVESSEGRDFEVLKETFGASKDIDFITFRILQGSESDDVYIIDSQKVQLQVSTLLKQAASYSASDSLGKDSDDDSNDYSFDEESGDSKDLSIEIYNAAYVQGIASEWQYYLEDLGYNITLVDTYQQEGPISTTRIVTDKDGIGEDLLQFFPEAEVSTGDIDTGGDIRIYIGTDYTTVPEH